MKKQIFDDEARKIEFNLLKQFARYCEKHNLRYYLAYGTLIGAVRHHGFIPWDNDVDVLMSRPDYELLIQMLKKEKIQSYIDYLDYREVRTFPFVKLIDNRTRLKEHFLVTEHNLGVYIDIFPMDGFPASVKKQRRLYQKAEILYNLFAMANYRFNTGANLGKRVLKCILYPFSRMISSKWVCKKLNSLCQKYSYDECDFVGNIVWGFGVEEIIPKSYLEEAYAEFEGESFCIPAAYDKFLRQCYGDYMQLPLEEERVTHAFQAEWRD